MPRCVVATKQEDGDHVSLLSGQTAVVTGGAQGLGLAIAQRFVDEGARVVLGDVNLEATQAAAAEAGRRRASPLAVRCDVTSADDVDALIGAAVDGFGALDIMINNAGITRDATMRKMTEEQFDQVIAVHLKGTWNGLRKAACDHAGEQERRDREHVVDLREGRHDRPDELFGGQGRHRRNDQGGVQGARPPRCAGQRDPARADPVGDDRGYAATDLGREARRDSDGASRRARTRSPRSRCSWPATCRRT